MVCHLANVYLPEPLAAINEMTKKFIHTDKDLHGSKVTDEFLIPDIIDFKAQFLGIESGKHYDSGLVVYTGMELTVEEVIERFKSSLGGIEYDSESLKNIISEYLVQIKGYKIGKVLTMTTPFNLEEEKW